VLGLIRPSIEHLAAISSSKKVAIWATSGTVKSKSYLIELNKVAPDMEIVQCACPLLVPHIEKGQMHTPEMRSLIQGYWKTTLKMCANLDTLLLACTHYPLLFEQIKAELPTSVNIVHQGQLIGHKWQDYLQRHPEQMVCLSQNHSLEYFTTGNQERMEEILTQSPNRAGAIRKVIFG